jgi:hypothetical protein
MNDEFAPPTVVYGVVYGGEEGGADEEARVSTGTKEGMEVQMGTERTTWVTRGVVTDDGLSIDRCAPAAEWFETSDAPATTPTLTTFLADLPPTAAAGLDFPFGLPEGVVVEETWEAFLRELPAWCDTPADLRRRCEHRVHLIDGSSDARLRGTDAPLSAMSPFDERIVASTYFGLRDVLRPLVLSDSVRVPPMTPPRSDRPFVIEVYPAGTLVDLDLFAAGYEAGDGAGRERRSETVEGLPGAVDADVDLHVDDAAREAAFEGPRRLESVVAAYAVYRNTRTASALTVSDPRRSIEGQVFV